MEGSFRIHHTGRADIEAVSAHTRHSFPRHVHDQFGIGVIEQGAHRSLSGRGTVEAAAGQVITVNPGEVHDGRPIDGAPRAWSMLYFAPLLARSLTDEAAPSGSAAYEFEHPVLSDLNAARHFTMLFRSLTGEHGILTDVLADQTLLLLFSAVARASYSPPSDHHAPAGVKIARELIDDDPARTVSLAELAAVAGLSRYQIVRGFARSTGLTPHAYIVQRRLQLARRLMARGRPLADIAASCGFSDQSHMTRLFRRTFGISPRAYSQTNAPLRSTKSSKAPRKGQSFRPSTS